MSWKENCVHALNVEKLFEDSGHRTRFLELVDCFSRYPFFTKGVCKCVYLSAWDEPHFCIMLETLTELSLGRETHTGEMRAKGESLVEEHRNEEYYVYQLSNAFLDDTPFRLPDNADVTPQIRYIVRRALEAAAVIDTL